MARATYLAFGGNLQGLWGEPQDTFARAISELELSGCVVLAVSPLYRSTSLSPGQPPYLNLVLACRAPLAHGQLLRIVKTIERRAGRRSRMKWSARPLDIDIVMHGSARMNWPHRGAGSLTLPHPESHRRAFVLKPLCDIAPSWFHPGLRLSAATLLRRLPPVHQQSAQPI